MRTSLNYLDFDMYSKRISFFFNNKEKIGSFFGLFLTIVYIIASLTLLLFQIIIVVQRQELRVYDSKTYPQEIPSITVDSEQLYFAFGLEDPKTSNRFIDDSIYTARVVFVDKVKENDEFKTAEERVLEYEQCKVEKFGDNYQHLFIKDELNNSYCLKNFFNLTFAGGYKYERMTYIRIRIYPCVNKTENNYTCKSQEEIDYYMSSGYFSIIIKDFGFNPSNYSFPVAPTLQDLFTTIDKKIIRNYILNFGITEIHTDTGFFSENKEVKRYLQYRKEKETFSFRDEQEYYNGKSVILVQMKLDDTLVSQNRTYTKIAEIFSRIGGYMQLMNTIFLLLTSIVNKLHSQLKIINSIFNFNLKHNKVILKFQTLKDTNTIKNARNNKRVVISSKKSLFNFNQLEDNKSKNNLIIKDKEKEKEFSNFSSGLNICENKKNESKNFIRISKKSNISFENSKNDNNNKKNEKSQNMLINSINFNNESFNSDNTLQEFNDHIYLHFFDFYCSKRNSIRYKLFNSGNYFYKKKIDIVHVFTLISITEKFFINNYYNSLFSLYEEIDLINPIKEL